MRTTAFWRCATAGAAAAHSGSARAPPTPRTDLEEAAAKNEANQTLIQNANVLYKWALQNDCRINNLALNLDPTFGRGLYSTHKQREGTTLLSIPLQKFSLSSAALEATPYVKATNPPDLPWFRQKMLNAGVGDIQMAEQMRLAVLLAIERTNPDSSFEPYFLTLPHPAVDVENESLYVDALDMIENAEYQALKEDFLGFLKYLLTEWKSTVPSAHPNMAHMDWAWRTVLARQHQLPANNLAPPPGSKLGFINYQAITASTAFYYRMRGFLLDSVQPVDYTLVPTMVPLLDACHHLPAANVSLEVNDRGGFGVCAELQAVREIEAGESVGYTFSRDATIGYTLYRFGFIPM